MSLKIRLARGGSKKRPHYSVVAADSRMPRDGRFLEKLGTYSPLLPKDSEDRVKMNLDRIKELLAVGAQPTDRRRLRDLDPRAGARRRQGREGGQTGRGAGRGGAGRRRARRRSARSRSSRR